MREHQIVINLKPDQFEEVQRMARAAGSKSVGQFVRQKLIGTLGLATPRTGAAEDIDAPDIKQLTGELRRLHRELQIFVADSLSNSDYTMSSIEPIPFPTAVAENFLAEGAPLMPESVGYSYRSESNISLPFSEASSSPAYPVDASESQFQTGQPQTPDQQQSPFLTEYPRPQLPGQFPPDSAAANSSQLSQQTGFQPTIQPTNQPSSQPTIRPSIQPSINQTRPAQTTDLQAPQAVPAANSDLQANPGIQPAYAITPDPNAASYAIPDPATMQPAYSVPEAPPEPTSSSPQPAAPLPSPTQPSAQVQSFAENDELEDLAERAFAISPRLGQLDEAVKRFPDPLKDLLEDALINGLDEVDEEVAESEATESDLPESEEDQEPPVSDQQTEESSSDVENFDTDESENASIEEQFEEEANYDQSEPETLTEAEDEVVSDDAPMDPPPPQPPPISGGPPPRKRRT